MAEADDGEILGYAYAAPFRTRSAFRFTVEDSIYLDPRSVGKGLGKSAAGAAHQDATACGKRQMIAVIGDSANLASIGVHVALGFEPTGTFRAVGFKFGRWVDSVLMQRSLGPGASNTPTNTISAR